LRILYGKVEIQSKINAKRAHAAMKSLKPALGIDHVVGDGISAAAAAQGMSHKNWQRFDAMMASKASKRHAGK
jgi:hypothetical protein